MEPGSVPPAGPYAPGIDVLHYDLEIGISDTAAWIEGRARIRLVADRPPDGLVRLDLTGLAVEEVRVDGLPTAFRQESGHLRVPLPASVAPGDTVEIQVAYRGTPDDALSPGPTVHGERAVFADNWPNRARFWFPSVDHPSDKATVRFTIHAPAAWEVVANGRLAAPPAPTPPEAPGPPGERRTWQWEESVPIPTYTMVFGAARFARRRVGLAACGRAPASPRADGCVEVSWWVFPPDTAAAGRAFGRAAEMVDFFSELVGPFPYEKLANVQSSTRFGGMENASAIFYSERALAGGRDMEGTTAHEIAHQWFGDAVTEAEWSHLWLSEGFATYFGALYFEHAEGEARFREIMEANRRRVVGSPLAARSVVSPAVRTLFELLNPIVYQKGAWVLHMLRGELGDEAFFRGIRRYYREHVNGTALTRDLQEALEEESGRDLELFFRQWLFEPGYPVLRATWRWDGERGEAEIVVTQEQPEEWPLFHFPLVVELATPDGPVRSTIRVDAREETLRVALPAPPTGLTLDPDGWLLKEIVQ